MLEIIFSSFLILICYNKFNHYIFICVYWKIAIVYFKAGLKAYNFK